jgi:hypothetical protein
MGQTRGALRRGDDGSEGRPLRDTAWRRCLRAAWRPFGMSLCGQTMRGCAPEPLGWVGAVSDGSVPPGWLALNSVSKRLVLCGCCVGVSTGGQWPVGCGHLDRRAVGGAAAAAGRSCAWWVVGCGWMLGHDVAGRAACRGRYAAGASGVGELGVPRTTPPRQSVLRSRCMAPTRPRVTAPTAVFSDACAEGTTSVAVHGGGAATFSAVPVVVAVRLQRRLRALRIRDRCRRGRVEEGRYLP